MNRLENPELDPHVHGQLIVTAGKNLHWEKDGLFNNGFGKSGQQPAEE